MSTQTLEGQTRSRVKPTVVNDFSIQVATVNGSGSQSSNSVLMRAIFQMGVPVSGKNLFPSNIQGLPTWFTIRASKHEYIARKREVDLLVAMNPQTAREDVTALGPGAAVVYEESLGLEKVRSDLVFYPVPFNDLARDVVDEPRLRKLLANMIYVGVVAQLLEVDRKEIRSSIEKQFKAKAKAVELNVKAVDIGFDYAEKTPHQGGSAPGRAHGPDGGEDPDRRQRRRSARLDVCGRHRRHLVPHHPVVEPRRAAHRLPQGLPNRREDGQGHLRRRSSGRRARRHRHGVGRRLGGGALHDLDEWTRRLADVGVRRPRVLSQRSLPSSGTSSAWGPRRDFRPAPLRATCSAPICSRTATRSISCSSRVRSASASISAASPSTSPSVSRPRFS